MVAEYAKSYNERTESVMAVAYYTADNENLDGFRPMTKDEAVQAYHALADEGPDTLADLYIDFYEFSQIEFLIFRDRLSSAILISNSATKVLDEWVSKLEATRKDGSYVQPGWEAESEIALDEKVHVAREAYRISIGATILTAVAALEALITDLVSDKGPKAQGLQGLTHVFFKIYETPEPEVRTIKALMKKVGKRRNTFAHSLTGSYWEKDHSVISMFTPEAMEDTLYTVGKIGVLLQEVVMTANSDIHNSE